MIDNITASFIVLNSNSIWIIQIAMPVMYDGYRCEVEKYTTSLQEEWGEDTHMEGIPSRHCRTISLNGDRMFTLPKNRRRAGLDSYIILEARKTIVQPNLPYTEQALPNNKVYRWEKRTKHTLALFFPTYDIVKLSTFVSNL